MATERNDLQIVIEAIDKATRNLEKIDKNLKELADSARDTSSAMKELTITFKDASGAVTTLAITVGDASRESKEMITTLAGIKDSAKEAKKGSEEASTGMKKLTESALAASSTFKMAGSGLKGLATAATSAVGPLGVVAIVIGAVVLAVAGLYKALKSLSDPYTEYETAVMGLSSVSAAFGQSQQGAKDAALELSSDGLIPLTTTINGLKSLLSTGLSLDKAINLMEAYKDEAAFGRVQTISYEQAVANLAESFKTENAMIGNLSGQVENYNYIIRLGTNILGIHNRELTAAERTEAKYLGTLEVAKKALGDTGRYTETYQGQLAKLEFTVRMIRIEIGTYFQPILKLFTKWLGNAADVTRGWLVPAMEVLAKVILIVVSTIKVAIDGLINYGDIAVGVFKSMASLSLSPLEASLQRSGQRMSTDFKDFMGTWADISDTTISDIMKNMADMYDETSDEAKQAAEDLAEAYESYMHSLESSNKAYKQSLEDLVIAHREAWGDIKEQIEDEKKTYQDYIKDRGRDFEKSMRDMAESHEKKTKSILSDIEDERKAAQEQIGDISEEWNALMELTTNAGTDRLANLQAQLDKELGLGEHSDQDKIDALLELISREQNALEQAIGNQAGARDDEIQEIQDDLNEKLAELQTELDEENTLYERSVQEKKEDYELDLANYKINNEEKLADLNEKLEEEERIRELYAEDFKRIGDKMAEDDITRLKRTHEEELKEMEHQYQKKIEDYQVYIDAVSNMQEGSAQEAVRITSEQLADQRDLYKEHSGGGGGGSWGESGGGFFDTAIGIMKSYEWAKNLIGFQHGGVVSKPSIVGEKGYPEVVLPLSEPQRMANILKSLGISGGGGGKSVEQHFHIVVNRQSDVDMIMERAAFNMKYK